MAVAFFLIALSGRGGLAAELTHGYMLGDVRPYGIKIWIRTDTAASVRIEYGTNPDLSDSSLSAKRNTRSPRDFAQIFTLSGLEPETTYYFNVLVDSVGWYASPYPSFTTGPRYDMPRDFEFAVLADQASIPRFPDQACPVFEYVAQHSPAFVVQIGDFDHRFDHWSPPRTVELFREMYKDLRSETTVAGLDFATYLRQFPFYYIYDDHDFGWQWADTYYGGPTRSPYLRNLMIAYYEYYPCPQRPNLSAGAWNSFRYAHCEFILLDARAQRDRQDDPDDENKSMLDGDNIPNSQKTWFKRRLLYSQATWKFIFCGVLLNDTVKRRGSFYQYQTEKQEILDFIADNNIKNVIWFSGDAHSGGAIDDGTNAGLPEVLVPHTNLLSHGTQTAFPGDWSHGVVPQGPDPPYHAGYALARIETDPDRVTLETRGVEGMRLQLVLEPEP